MHIHKTNGVVRGLIRVEDSPPFAQERVGGPGRTPHNMSGRTPYAWGRTRHATPSEK